jgi:hypothetical protein
MIRLIRRRHPSSQVAAPASLAAPMGEVSGPAEPPSAVPTAALGAAALPRRATQALAAAVLAGAGAALAPKAAQATFHTGGSPYGGDRVDTRLTVDENLLVLGSLTGIGTPYPTTIGTCCNVTLLHVHRTGTAGAAVLQLTNDQSAINLVGSIDFGSTAITSGEKRCASIYGVKMSSGTSGNTGALIFATAGGVFEKMRIDATGNVGIGTQGPTAKLDVAGAIKCNGQNGLDASGIAVKAYYAP